MVIMTFFYVRTFYFPATREWVVGSFTDKTPNLGVLKIKPPIWEFYKRKPQALGVLK
jgi:hypothetical protein